jgi:thiamine biosynthesis lipoprotein
MTAVSEVDDQNVSEWSVWTTTVRLVVTDPSHLRAARELVRDYLAEVDVAASRFRSDSEVSQIARSNAEVHAVSPVLRDLLEAALTAAAETDGGVDPTLGTVLTHLGYGVDGSGSTRVRGEPEGFRITAHRAAAWRDVSLDGRELRLPPGTLLDLGATAKAHAADRCAVRVATVLGCGVLVSLGGDLRVAGREPVDGWNVLVQDGDGEPASQVRLTGAHAVATSSTLHRTWRHNGHLMHHLIDPATGAPAPAVWRTVSVAAATCLRANTLSTHAMVLGERAVPRLVDEGAAARLVRADGEIVHLGGWPA